MSDLAELSEQKIPKPDRTTAMRQIIEAVKAEFPLYEPSTYICGANTDCQGCPKKLL